MLADEWHSLEKSRFNSLFKSSAVQRTGYKGLMRNLQFLRDGKD
jgi:epoxyqueuosine reductase